MMENVRENTSPKINAKIDSQTRRNIYEYSHKGKSRINERLEELDKEWDIERVLELNASLLALTGIGLGLSVHKRWFILPAVVTAFLAHHAIQGWCPPVPFFRMLGYRTRSEINRERTALKALKGEFKDADDVEKIWEAVI